MADLLDDPLEIGKRIGSACGYATEKTQQEIADEIGVSDVTLRSYVKGNLGDFGRTRELRESLIRKVEQVTECPTAIFGLSEPGSDQRWELVEEKLNFLLEAVRRLAGSQVAPDEFRQWWTSDPRSGELDL